MNQQHRLKKVVPFLALLFLAASGLLATVSAPKAAGQEKKEDAAKQLNRGMLQMGSKTFELNHAVAYETRFFREMVTVVLLTEKPIPAQMVEGLKEALKTGRDEGIVSFRHTGAYAKLFLFSNSLASVYICGDNRPISTNVGLKCETKIADGRARGRVFMPKPEKAFDEEHRLDVTFDVAVIQVPLAKPEPKPPAPEPKRLVVEKELRFEGQLAKNSPKVLGKPAQIHELKMSPDRTYIIDLESTDFNAYLRILDSTGKQLAKDDDSGGNHNARLRFTPPRDDTCQVVATLFGFRQGNYVLKIRVLQGQERP